MAHLAELSSWLMVAFVTDASISLWRKGKPGDRRRSITVGGKHRFLRVSGANCSRPVSAINSPFTYPVGLWFFAIVAAMGYDQLRSIARNAVDGEFERN